MFAAGSPLSCNSVPENSGALLQNAGQACCTVHGALHEFLAYLGNPSNLGTESFFLLWG